MGTGPSRDVFKPTEFSHFSRSGWQIRFSPNNLLRYGRGVVELLLQRPGVVQHVRHVGVRQMRVPQTLVREFESSHIMPGLMIPMPGAAFRALRDGIKHGFHLAARTFAHFFGGFLAVKEQVLVPHHQPGELDVHIGLVPLPPHVDDGRVVSGRPFPPEPHDGPRLHDGVRAALGLCRDIVHSRHAWTLA